MRSQTNSHMQDHSFQVGDWGGMTLAYLYYYLFEATKPNIMLRVDTLPYCR